MDVCDIGLEGGSEEKREAGIRRKGERKAKSSILYKSKKSIACSDSMNCFMLNDFRSGSFLHNGVLSFSSSLYSGINSVLTRRISYFSQVDGGSYTITLILTGMVLEMNNSLQRNTIHTLDTCLQLNRIL